MAYGAIILTLVFWSSSFVGIKYALEFFTPGGLAILRYLIASLVMILIAPFLIPISRIHLSKRHCIMFTIFGFLGVFAYHVGLNYGELTVTSATASFLVAQIPIATVLLNSVIFKESIKGLAIFGILLGLAGTILILFAEGQNYQISIGVFWIIGAVIAESTYFILQKKAFEKFSLFEINFYTNIFGTILMLPFLSNAFVHGAPSTFSAWVVLIYLGIFPAAVAYFLWSFAIKKVGVVATTSSLYALPFFTLIIGFLALQEIPSIGVVFGGSLALIGAFFVHKAR